MKKSLPIILFFTMLFFITIGINSTVYATGEKEYAKYDSSDNTLTLFTSDEDYTNGQVDGTITYYASFADTHYEDAANIPWNAVKENVKTVTFEDTIKPKYTEYWFSSCMNLEKINNIEKLDTSEDISMRSMFYNCENLEKLDVSGFDTSNVTSMRTMFYGCKKLTEIDVSGFNTSKVTNMAYMFGNCFLLESIDLSNFNTSKVTDMGNMFRWCKSLKDLDVSYLNTSNVTDMSYMFYAINGIKTLDLTTFNTSKVRNMNYMFCQSDSLEDIDLSSFNMSSIQECKAMFAWCSKLKTIFVKPGTVWSIPSAENSIDMFSGTVLPGYSSDSVDISKARTIDLGGYFNASLKNANLKLKYSSKSYTGKVIVPVIEKVTSNGIELVEGTDYIISNSGKGTTAGKYTVEITGIGTYVGTAKTIFTINKASNTLTVKGKTAKVKYYKLRQKKQVLSAKSVMTVSKAKGTVTYKKSSGNKNITINKKTGKVTIKKRGLKRGKTYSVKVKVYAAGNTSYKSISKTVTIKIKVK